MNALRTIFTVLAGLVILCIPPMVVAFFIITRDPANAMGGWGAFMFVSAVAFGLAIVWIADSLLNRP